MLMYSAAISRGIRSGLTPLGNKRSVMKSDLKIDCVKMGRTGLVPLTGVRSPAIGDRPVLSQSDSRSRYSFPAGLSQAGPRPPNHLLLLWKSRFSSEQHDLGMAPARINRIGAVDRADADPDEAGRRDHELLGPAGRAGERRLELRLPPGFEPVELLGRPAPVWVRHRGYQLPVLGIEVQGSAGALASPFCRISIEILSGDFTKAMRPSRGGRLMVTPCSISLRQVS